MSVCRRGASESAVDILYHVSTLLLDAELFDEVNELLGDGSVIPVVDAVPCGSLGGGGTFGSDLNDAVESAADFLACMVDDHLMGGVDLLAPDFGHEPQHGGKIISVAVSRKLNDIPAVTAVDAARMLGVSSADPAKQDSTVDPESQQDTNLASHCTRQVRQVPPPAPNVSFRQVSLPWLVPD